MLFLYVFTFFLFFWSNLKAFQTKLVSSSLASELSTEIEKVLTHHSIKYTCKKGVLFKCKHTVSFFLSCVFFLVFSFFVLFILRRKQWLMSNSRLKLSKRLKINVVLKLNEAAVLDFYIKGIFLFTYRFSIFHFHFLFVFFSAFFSFFF